ncbi:MAG TPA: SPOR domain-containing protein, partial [Sulfitobacter sp.]|nr:SPOR domain-containing protein [Sulfitobacter sp.]
MNSLRLHPFSGNRPLRCTVGVLLMMTTLA